MKEEEIEEDSRIGDGGRGDEGKKMEEEEMEKR
jgi:hypothetical protein